jgi:hypothetical protein
MSQIQYVFWGILIVFVTTLLNISSSGGGLHSASRSWSTGSGSGWSSGGGHK